MERATQFSEGFDEPTSPDASAGRSFPELTLPLYEMASVVVSVTENAPHLLACPIEPYSAALLGDVPFIASELEGEALKAFLNYRRLFWAWNDARLVFIASRLPETD